MQNVNSIKETTNYRAKALNKLCFTESKSSIHSVHVHKHNPTHSETEEVGGVDNPLFITQTHGPAAETNTPL